MLWKTKSEKRLKYWGELNQREKLILLERMGLKEEDLRLGKICNKCKLFYGFDLFYFAQGKRRSICKECTNKTTTAYFNANKEQYNTYHKKYRKENLEFYRAFGRKWAKERGKTHPWESHYYSAKSRCNNKNSLSYKSYGQRGIKLLLNLEDVKQLWFKDKAYELHFPSLDRIRSKENYEIGNVRFIEFRDNCSRDKIKVVQNDK